MDRRAIVTGGASGLGLGIAHRLAGAGVRVCLADVDASRLDAVVGQFDGYDSGPVHTVAADLSTREGAAELVDSTLEAFGRVDILVNNAGGGVIRPTGEHTEATLRETVDRNLWTMVYCTLGLLPHLVANHYGRVVSLGAESVRNGLYRHAFYSAAKGGVHGFTTGLAREYATQGITVNVVAPAMVITPEFSDQLAAMSSPARADWDDFLAQIRATIPMGRAGTLNEVAAAVEYLASDDAGYVTGQVLSVNGGSSML